MFIPDFKYLKENCDFSTVDDVALVFPGIDYSLFESLNSISSNTNLGKEKNNPIVDGIVLGRSNPLTYNNSSLFGLSLCELEDERKFLVPFYADSIKKTIFLDESFGIGTATCKMSDLSGLEKLVSEKFDSVNNFRVSSSNLPDMKFFWAFGACGSVLFDAFISSSIAGVSVMAGADAYLTFKKNRENYFREVFEKARESTLKLYV